MDVSITSWGEVEITAETTITVDLDDVLNEVSVEQLIDALDWQGADWVGTIVKKQGAESILDEIDEDDLKAYVKDNGLGAVDATLDDFGIQELIDELNARNCVHDMLMCVDSEFIQEHMEQCRGGFTLENVPKEDLIGALGARGLYVVTVPVEVAKAFSTVTEFLNEKNVPALTELGGARFIIE